MHRAAGSAQVFSQPSLRGTCSLIYASACLVTYLKVNHILAKYDTVSILEDSYRSLLQYICAFRHPRFHLSVAVISPHAFCHDQPFCDNSV